MHRVFALFACCFMLFGAAIQAAEPTTADLLAALKSADQATRLTAIDHLAARGAKAAEAVPALTDLLKDPSALVRAHAAHALGQMGEAGKAAVPELAKLIGDADPGVRRKVVAALRELRPGPAVGVPLFAKVMADGDPGVRLRAMNALADAGEEAVPFLTEALKNEKAAYWACLVLRDIGPTAKAAVPALAELTANQNPEIRREAILALAAMGEAAAPATPQLVKALDDPLDRTAATFALGAIGAAPPDVQKKIREKINDKEELLRVASIWAVAKFHKGDVRYTRWATESLISFLRFSDPRSRQAAARALADLKPGPEIAVPIFEKVFQGASDKAIEGALEALASLGPEAAVPLTRAFRYERLRPRVAHMIGKLGPAAAPATEALAALLEDANAQTRQEAAIALGKIGPAAKAAVPALTKALAQAEPLCYAAAYALGEIGPDAVAAEAALLKTVEGKDESAVLISAWALAKINPKSEPNAAKVVPVLVRGLGDEHAKYRLGASEALKAFGPLAKSAAPALEKAAKDVDPAVQAAAAEALKAVGG